MVTHQSFIKEYYTGSYCHWCPLSQPYAGGDALLSYLGSGWEVHDDVYYEEYWHNGNRRVLIYFFTLANARQRVVMRVLTNPFVERLLRELQVRVLSVANRARLHQPRSVLPSYSDGPYKSVEAIEKRLWRVGMKRHGAAKQVFLSLDDSPMPKANRLRQDYKNWELSAAIKKYRVKGKVGIL